MIVPTGANGCSEDTFYDDPWVREVHRSLSIGYWSKYENKEATICTIARKSRQIPR